MIDKHFFTGISSAMAGQRNTSGLPPKRTIEKTLVSNIFWPNNYVIFFFSLFPLFFWERLLKKNCSAGPRIHGAKRAEMCSLGGITQTSAFEAEMGYHWTHRIKIISKWPCNRNRFIGGSYHIQRLFFRPKFQGISPQSDIYPLISHSYGYYIAIMAHV